MLVFVPDEHRYRVDPETGEWEFVYAVLYGRELLRLLHELRVPASSTIAWPHGSPAESALLDLVETVRSARRASPFELSSRAYRLATALHEGPSVGSGSRIERAKIHIESHLDSGLTLDTLAGVAGLSRHHFSREFARATGLPPVRYVREARCERAAVLLTTTGLSVKEIADRCGFESSSYFCRVFRASTGMSPAEYRKTRP
jgi:AraC-like DNA-binding protein